jgi:hypothetical protein
MMNPLIARRSLLLLPLLGIPSAWCAQEDGPAPPRPPAPTLKPSTSASLRVDSRGFIRRWRVQEPIAVSGRLTQTEVEKILGETPWSATPTSSVHALDTTAYNFNLYHFAWALSKPTSNALFWVVTSVDVPADMANVRLAIGSNAASAWWLDDERVISLFNDRQSVIDDGVSRRLQLRKGRHVIRAAIINGGGATDFCARFVDDAGRPITTLSTPPAPAL